MALRYQQRGFGLIEVTLASSILVMVVGATIGLVRSSLRRTTIGLERSVAMNLAQEPIEQLRSFRDSVFIDTKNNTWTDIWPSTTKSNCKVMITQSSNGCPRFKLVAQSGAWQVTAGTEVPIQLNGQTYTREIYISTPAGYAQAARIPNVTDDAALVRKIHVIVRWDSNAQAVESASYLTNWRTDL